MRKTQWGVVLEDGRRVGDPLKEPMDRIIVGVDESGNGAIAGPVMVSAVAFFPDDPIVETTYQGGKRAVYLKACDCKKLKKPEHVKALAEAIRRKARAHVTITRSPEEIDQKLISKVMSEAIRLAIARVLERLAPAFPNPSMFEVLIDGKIDVPPGIPCLVNAIPGGDETTWQIGAASILARDAFAASMEQISLAYPGYAFDKHNGYPTPVHKEALRRLGPTPMHRRSFRPVYESMPLKKGVEL